MNSNETAEEESEGSTSPNLLEVDMEDLEAVYATLEEYQTALKDAQEEIVVLSTAVVDLERENELLIQDTESKRTTTFDTKKVQV